MSQIASPDTEAVERELADKSPGRRLREIRERRKFSVQQVASDLNLTPATIEALEKDQFERLPGPVFARGYLRSYAKLLDVPPEPLVAAIGGPSLDPPKTENVSVHRPMPMSRRYAPIKGIVSTLAVLSILTGAGWWAWDHWYQQGAGAADLSAAYGEADTDTSAPPAAPVLAGDNMDPKQVPVALGELPEPSANAILPTPVPAPAEEDNSIIALVDAYSRGGSQRSKAGEVEPVSLTDESVAEPLETPASERTVDEPESGRIASIPPLLDDAEAVLAFRFSEDSWVEVRDAESSRRLTGLMKAGSEHTVDGRPPFTVTVGNSRGTIVLLNGEEFDHSRFNRGNVSRFTVGGG